MLLSVSIFLFSSLLIPTLTPRKSGLPRLALGNENSFLFNKAFAFLEYVYDTLVDYP